MKRSWLLAAVTALGLIAPAAASAAPAAASAVPAAAYVAAAASGPAVHGKLPVVTICLTYARSFCADVAHDHDVSGEPIWIWSASHAGDDHFYELQVNCPVSGENICIQFADVRSPGLCIGIINNRNAVLQGCNAFATEWVQVAQGSHYVHWANAVEYLTASGNADGKAIFINYLHGGGWQQWTGA